MKMSKNNINELNKSIKNLENKNFFTIYESYWKMFYISLIKGLASGLGWVIGATLLVSILTFILLSRTKADLVNSLTDETSNSSCSL